MVGDIELYVELGIRLEELQKYRKETRDWFLDHQLELSDEQFDQEMRDLMKLERGIITLEGAIDVLFPTGDPHPTTLERSNNGNS